MVHTIIKQQALNSALFKSVQGNRKTFGILIKEIALFHLNIAI